MELVPLGPGFGVEVKGVTMLDVATDADAYKAVRAAFEEHSLLVFRDQPIADDIQVAYSRAFGPLELTKVASLGAGGFYSRLTNIGEKGEILPPDHRQVLVAKANALWHTDSLVQEDAGARLGADRARAAGRGRRHRVHLDAACLGAPAGRPAGASSRTPWRRTPMPTAATRSIPTSPMPRSARRCRRCAGALNWRNPANDRRALYVASHAYAIDGMDDRDARQLLAQLLDEATRREFVYTHKWRQGDAVMWDNRAMLHRGRPWDYSKERSMIRTTISATDADGLAEVRPPVLH